MGSLLNMRQVFFFSVVIFPNYTTGASEPYSTLFFFSIIIPLVQVCMESSFQRALLLCNSDGNRDGMKTVLDLPS